MSTATYFNKLLNIILCFFIYSFCGWVIETIYMSIYHGHLVNRGFLMGPLCGVYGIGTIIVVYFLCCFKFQPKLLFLYSSILISILELVVGVLLEKLLNQKLWDYSDNFADFMGYICVRNSIIWGFLALLVVYLVHPIISKIIVSIPIKTKIIICSSLCLCMTFDLMISIYTSLMGINNISWVSQLLIEKIENLRNVTSKVVYYISR